MNRFSKYLSESYSRQDLVEYIEGDVSLVSLSNLPAKDNYVDDLAVFFAFVDDIVELVNVSGVSIWAFLFSEYQDVTIDALYNDLLLWDAIKVYLYGDAYND